MRTPPHRIHPHRLIVERSIMTPPSQTARPATLWPPPRMESGRFSARAKAMARMTSAAPAQRTIAAGLRSIQPL
jgi:hypothetical protein